MKLSDFGVGGIQSGFGSDFGLIHIAPTPVFARLERFDDGVLGRVEMFGGVTVGRAIAASDVAAHETEAKVDPLSADLQAIFATLRRRSDILYFFDVFAGHGALLIPRGVSGFRNSML
jgi:hypothetical protein